jgi:EAL domain-containing protein (putative c-di-GMP-specific phosphodiesterase class I)
MVLLIAALARGPKGSGLESPMAMLDLAEDAELVTELDMLMVESSVRASAAINKTIFINVLPTTLTNSEFAVAEMIAMLARAGRSPQRVVLEISERQRIGEDLAEALVRARRAGFQIALDDVGTRNANLSEIAALRPEWLKLDRALIEDVHIDEVKRDLVAVILEFGRKQGSRVLAEGVEQAEELEMLRRLGIEYFQGYLLGRPHAAPVASSPSSDAVDELRSDAK